MMGGFRTPCALILIALVSPAALANPLRATGEARVLMMAPIAGRTVCTTETGALIPDLIQDVRRARTTLLRDEINPKGGTSNCVTCAIALDHTMSGRAASALPSDGPRPFYDVLVEYPLTSRDMRTFGTWESFSTFAHSGEFERAFVFLTRQGEETGHMLNLAMRGGVPYLLDGQRGIAQRLDAVKPRMEAMGEIRVFQTNRELPALGPEADHMEVHIETHTGEVLKFP